MAAFAPARVTAVKHWNERLFSFKTEREPAFRFENGHFTMVGLEVNGKPALRAYSIASANSTVSSVQGQRSASISSHYKRFTVDAMLDKSS